MHEEFLQSDVPLGVLWVMVDQARGCCGARTERGPAKRCWKKWSGRWRSGLQPAEEIGRWGDDEFLVLSHERTPADAGGACTDAGRAGAHDGFSLVGRSHFADGEHWRGAG